jgi:hypothetical protein
MKLILSTILLGLFLSLGAYSQEYAIPKKLPIERAVKRELAEWRRMPNGYPGLVPETFFPIGWSKDGKFAYYFEPVDEACGCYYAGLIIQDMRNDKVLWEFKYNQDDDRDPQTGDMKGQGNIRQLWVKNKKLFSEKLRENGIVASRSVLLGKMFTAAGSSYTAKATKKMGKNVDGDDERVNFYTITLTSPKLGSKKVATTYDHTKDDYWFMLDANVIGAIKSPYENRVAIIAIEVMRGYEGPPHTGDLNIVGADLRSGFSKK